MSDTNEVSPLRQVRSPEGYEGWQWGSGLTFYYNKDDANDNVSAQLLAMECGEVTMRVQRLQVAAHHRSRRVFTSEPIILNFEEKKHNFSNVRLTMMTLGKFRQMTAELPDNTPMLSDAPDHCYRNAYPGITTAIVVPNPCSFEPDYGNNPELYGLLTEEHVKRNRVAVVVFE
jgi:hypothetical protein